MDETGTLPAMRDIIADTVRDMGRPDRVVKCWASSEEYLKRHLLDETPGGED